MNVYFVIVLSSFDFKERSLKYNVNHISQIIQHQENELNDRIFKTHR